MMRNLHLLALRAVAPGLGAALALLLATAPGTARAVTIGLSASVGSHVTITVSVAGIESLAEPSLGAYDLDLFFDDSVLAFSDIDFASDGLPYSVQSLILKPGIVDFAELTFASNDVLRDVEPDSFVLATLNFDILVREETLTTVGLSQTLLSDGNGQAIRVDPVAPIELTATIPEASGAHVFALGALLMFAGHWLLSGGHGANAARQRGRGAAPRTGS